MYYTYFCSVFPMDLPFKGDLCLLVFLCWMCWDTSGRSTRAWERVRALFRIILHLPCLLWINSYLFPVTVHTLEHVWCQGRNMLCLLGAINVRGVEVKESKRCRQKCSKEWRAVWRARPKDRRKQTLQVWRSQRRRPASRAERHLWRYLRSHFLVSEYLFLIIHTLHSTAQVLCAWWAPLCSVKAI